VSINFPSAPAVNDIFSSAGLTWRWDGTKWVITTSASAVTSVNTRIGAVVLNSGDVTSALGYTPYNSGNPNNYQSLTQVNNALVNYVPLAGGTITGAINWSGTPSAPTHLTTKAYVDAAVAAAAPVGMPYIVTTAGQSSVTGTTSETNLAALLIPGGTMGRNGFVQVAAFFSYPNNSNSKTYQIRFSTTAGGVTGGIMGQGQNVTTTLTSQGMWIIRNNNATNAQSSYGGAGMTPFSAIPNGPFTLAQDTTVNQYVNINGILAVGTDTLTLIHAYAVVFPHG